MTNHKINLVYQGEMDEEFNSKIRDHIEKIGLKYNHDKSGYDTIKMFMLMRFEGKLNKL